FKRGAWTEASKWFELSLSAKLALLAEQPQNGEMLDAVANSRFWLALAAHVQGQSTQAMALYNAARATQAQRLAEHPKEASRLRDLSATDVNRAETLQALGQAAEAQRTMAAAVAGLQEAAAADP